LPRHGCVAATNTKPGPFTEHEGRKAKLRENMDESKQLVDKAQTLVRKAKKRIVRPLRLMSV